MDMKIEKSAINGAVDMPASKSHTVRAAFFGALADGISHVKSPLISRDTLAALSTIRAFGARVAESEGLWVIEGVGGKPSVPENVIDVGNSGTTLYIGLPVAALADGYTVFTGDEQIRRRPAGSLLDALCSLGAHALSTRANGCPPAVVKGPMKGGRATVNALTSQYVTGLLIAGACAEGPVEVFLESVVEKPYIEMTLGWLASQGVAYECEDFVRFKVPGGHVYKPFERRIPGDFSSATFFLVAAAIAGGKLNLEGLDMEDTQGDKAVVDYLRQMGANIKITDTGLVVEGSDLEGAELDLNATPDALPAMAVAGCFANGKTRLVNVAQARVKETDRIAVMTKELGKMGAKITEMDDGLEIKGVPLQGAAVDGHDDHRIVMALAVAGLAAKGQTIISGAEAADVTFPDFKELMLSAGAKISS